MLPLQIMEVLDTHCGAKSKQGRKLREATTAFFSLGKCKNIKILTENMQPSKAAHARINFKGDNELQRRQQGDLHQPISHLSAHGHRQGLPGELI